jgi:CheY-like chemotaxis protein
MEQVTILVVDDDTQIREVLTEHLTSLGYGIIQAASAEEALQRLEETTPDLVLTDVHMGGMSGIDLCARLKRDQHFQLMPVIILTGQSDLQARVAGLAPTIFSPSRSTSSKSVPAWRPSCA